MVHNVHRVFAHILEREDARITLTQDGSSLRTSTGLCYYAKIGSTNDRDQFVGEAESIRAMYEAAPGLVPKLLDCGIIDSNAKERNSDIGRPYFLSEYKGYWLTEQQCRQGPWGASRLGVARVQEHEWEVWLPRPNVLWSHQAR